MYPGCASRQAFCCARRRAARAELHIGRFELRMRCWPCVLRKCSIASCSITAPKLGTFNATLTSGSIVQPLSLSNVAFSSCMYRYRGHANQSSFSWAACFWRRRARDNDRTRTVHFGSARASDYTQHRDPVRKRQYLARHAPREHWENPMTAGALARWILWNKETLPSSIEDYTRRFGLAAV